MIAKSGSLAGFIGRIVCFVGAAASDATVNDLSAVEEMARNARIAGIDTLVFRRGNGTLPLPDHNHLLAEAEVCNAAGVGWLPYLYSYGPRFGDQQIAGEVAHLAALAAVKGVVVADMEAQWDGQYRAAQYFERLMRPVPCRLIVTSWANVMNHAFPVAALAPCVDAWAPQDYDNFLAAQTWQQTRSGETIRFPALDLTSEFGPNDPARIAGSVGGETLFLWEYEHAVADPVVVHEIRTARGW